jgi:sugar/nucleoside kinase (ribokinase family)
MLDVICLGIFVVDVIARPVNSYPGRGELQVCDFIAPFIGGCAANTGIGLSRLGIATGVAGKVGRDGFGDFVRAICAAEDIDARGIVSDETVSTSATMVMVAADSERSFIHYFGANSAFRETDVDWDFVRQAKLLHIAGHFLMPGFDGAGAAAVVARAHTYGLITALDTAGQCDESWAEAIAPVLPHLDYFLPSYAEARYCTPYFGTERDTPENVARYFQEQGVGVVALKMGEAGSYVLGPDGIGQWHLPAYKVDAIDATGAGDAFAAGFLAGVIRGYDLEMCGKLGNAAGACCVTALGTVAGMRSLDETLALVTAGDNAQN